MRKKYLSYLLLLLPFAAIAQDKGIRFETGLSWSAIQARAKAENKYIFVDLYTTWCGPCKYMSTTIFPQEESGNFFNDKFISVAVQLDSTAKDNAAVKAWYADAHGLMATHDIRIFPTYLVYSPDGRPLHRIAGSSPSPAAFISKVQDAFDTTKQYYGRIDAFRQGRRDTAFLRSLALDAATIYDMANGHLVADAYLSTLSDAFSPGGLEVLFRYTEQSGDKGFAVLTGNAIRIDQVMGAATAESQINDILAKEYIYPKLSTGGAFGPDWKAINRTIAAKYPAYAGAVTEYGKIFYFMYKEDWKDFQKAIIPYMQQYGANASPENLNQYAWSVFKFCPDMTCVADAVVWSKRALDGKPEPSYMDTYANILYKLGKKDDAIAMEEKAMGLVAPVDRSTYATTIDKMKKGEKTW